MTVLTHSYWTFSTLLRHRMDPVGTRNEEVNMRQSVKNFHWSYLFQVEDSTTPEHSLFARTCKTMVMVGISVLIGMGMSQLT